MKSKPPKLTKKALRAEALRWVNMARRAMGRPRLKAMPSVPRTALESATECPVAKALHPKGGPLFLVGTLNLSYIWEEGYRVGSGLEEWYRLTDRNIRRGNARIRRIAKAWGERPFYELTAREGEKPLAVPMPLPIRKFVEEFDEGVV